MTYTNSLLSLSDDELLQKLSELVHQSRRVEADLVAHIGEVDDRRLYARSACSSMFVYCTEILHLSEGETHHHDPYGRGGDHHPSRIRLLCKTRNLLLAERDYGKKVIEKNRRNGSRVSEPPSVYGVA